MREIELMISHTVEFERETAVILPCSDYLIRVLHIPRIQLQMLFHGLGRDTFQCRNSEFLFNECLHDFRLVNKFSYYITYTE